MENKKKKCSLSEHKETEAILYCIECNVYMCTKCEKLHSGLFKNHHQYNLDKDINEIFTGICKEENHFGTLKFFRKTHNKLCCASCITKIKGKEYGQHNDCDVCDIKDIEEEKKKKLSENIKYLELLSNLFFQTLNEIKNIS